MKNDRVSIKNWLLPLWLFAFSNFVDVCMCTFGADLNKKYTN